MSDTRWSALRTVALAVIAASIASVAASVLTTQAQLPSVSVVGAVTPGNCTKFLSTLQLSDNGSTCAGAAPVQSVFGRTGAVVAAANDYNFNQLAGSVNLATQVSGQLVGTNGGTGINNGANTITTGGTINTAAGLISTGAGQPTLAFPGTARTYTFANAAGTILSTAGAIAQTNCSNPTGTTSLTFVQMGCGAPCVITPVASSRLHIFFSGNATNNTASDGGFAHVSYGTGTAPVNGAAATGTSVGNSVFINNANTAATSFPFAIGALATALTPGVTVWFDLQLQALTGGTASLQNISCFAYEM